VSVTLTPHATSPVTWSVTCEFVNKRVWKRDNL
jgi:hypothetical protein